MHAIVRILSDMLQYFSTTFYLHVVDCTLKKLRERDQFSLGREGGCRGRGGGGRGCRGEDGEFHIYSPPSISIPVSVNILNQHHKLNFTTLTCS